MTRVKSSQRDSDRSVPSHSTTSSSSSVSNPVDTPDSLDFDPDVAIPSIERDTEEASAFSTHENLTPRARTPSISVTPSDIEGIGTPSSSRFTSYGTSPTPGSTILSLAGRMGDLKLSPEPVTPRTSSSRSSHTHGDGQARLRGSSATSLDDDRSTLGSRNSTIASMLENVRLGTETPQRDPSRPSPYLDPRSPSPNLRSDSVNSTPRNGSRRRSGSHIGRDPHKVADEVPPRERFHEPEFQGQFAKAKKLVADLVNVLASSPLHNEANSVLRTRYLQAVELSRFQSLSARIVGLVGDSGVGKSSLINSLLDINGFARSSNSGAACTCVATEYHYREGDDFVIEIGYFTLDQLQRQFTELLRSYRYHHLHAVSDSSATADERAALEENAKVARDTFLAAFRGHLAGKEQMLLDGPEETVLQKLLTWARESGFPLGERAGAGSERELFKDASSCSNRLTELTSESNSPNETLAWPYIREIKVYLDAHILSKGLILADLPGLRDLNSARLKVTERYLLKCDEIFAICHIGRATTDAGVMEVFELGRRASLPKIGIICTKSDDIMPAEVQGDWAGNAATVIKTLARDWAGDVATLIRDLVQDLARTQQGLNEIEAEIEDLTFEGDGDHRMDDEEQDELNRLNDAARKARKRIERREFELKKLLVTTRNEKVTDGLRARYRDKIPGGDLSIFCVSNVDYWGHRQRPRREALPYLRLSGIFEVRKHCLSIVAEGQLSAAIEYMTNAIPALLGSVELWVQSGSGSLTAERKQAVRDILQQIEGALDDLSLPSSRINNCARLMERMSREQITPFMRESSSRWSQAAVEATIEWHGWSHGIYSAFCRNFGDYCTNATMVPRCWNDEAMEVMVSQMRAPWQKFEERLHAMQDDVTGAVDDAFDRANEMSNDTGGLASDSLRTLATTLRHRQALLISAVEKLEWDFQTEISALRTNTLTGIRSSSIGQLMEASYHQCNNDSGRGSDARRKAVIRAGFSNARLFESIRRMFAERFAELARDFEHKVREAVATHLAVVQGDVDTLKNENVALESERQPEFRRTLGETVSRMRQEMEAVDAVVSGYRGGVASET